MVTSLENRKTIICLHQNGVSPKDIAQQGLANVRTVQRIIKSWTETGSSLPKKGGGRPKVSNEREDRHLIRSQLSNRFATSPELTQQWKEVGVDASQRTVRRRLFNAHLPSRRAAKKPLLSKKNIKDRLAFCRKYRQWTVEQWSRVIFSDEAPFRLFGTSGKALVRRRKGERFNQDCLVPTVKHPGTVHVWGCFSAQGIGALHLLPKNTAMNGAWYEKVVIEELLPSIDNQFPDQNCIFQHDGAPCHRAGGVKRLLNDFGIEELTPWPGNSPDLNPIENLWSILKQKVNKKRPTATRDLEDLILHEWNSIDINLTQKLISSMPKRIEEVLRNRGQHCKY